MMPLGTLYGPTSAGEHVTGSSVHRLVAVEA